MLTNIELDEGQTTEFKCRYNNGNVLHVIASLANSGGGDIYLGVEKDKEVVGINYTPELKDQIQSVAIALRSQ